VVLETLPAYAGARTAEPTAATTGVPAVALVVRAAENLNPNAPAALLRPCVTISCVVHPLLVAALTAAVGRVGAGSRYVRPTRVAPAAARRAVTSAHPSLWRAGAKTPLAQTLGPALSEAIGVTGSSRPKRLARQALLVTRTGHTLRVTPSLDKPLELAEHALSVGDSVHLDVVAAHTVIEIARAAGLIVFDATAPGVMPRLAALVERGVRVLPVPGAPAHAVLEPAPGATFAPADRGPMPAAKAVAVAAALKSGTAVATHPDVSRAVAMARAASGTTRADGNLEGLRPWQELFVNTALAAGPGIVNALPPGAGKTVCSTGVMVRRTGLVAAGTYQAVVVAPAPLRSQWEEELNKFAPHLSVTVAETAETVTTYRRAAGEAPQVLVVSPQLVAKTIAEHADVYTCDDLFVDEAVYLANPDTRQSRALWEVRRRSGHATVLTGTPAGRGAHVLRALVAFAQNRPDLQDPPAGVVAPYGDLVFTGPGDVRDHLPASHPVAVTCAPGPVERAIEAAASQRVLNVLGADTAKAAVKLRAELEAWRLGLASPSALAASKYALADELRHLIEDGHRGVKEQWVLERVAAEKAEGRQALVFSDFASALELLDADMAARGVSAAVLTSARPAKERKAAVDAFGRGDVDVLLIGVSGQLGLNLQAAATVLHLDVPTTAAALEQRTARAARLGGTRARVTVDIPVLDDCADLRLVQHLAADTARGDVVALADHLTAGS
jgi:hypothetical protein